MRIMAYDAHMKQRINLTIDAELISRARAMAHQQKSSISRLVEKGLEGITKSSGRRHRSFADQWAARLKLAPRNPADQKREYLWRKYGLAGNADSHRH
jgi:post-segregation antitoxin (ccd killing protein)